MVLFPAFKRLMNPNPKARMTPQQFLEFGMAETAGEGSGFFAKNRLVKVCAGLDNFSLSNEAEKNILLRYVGLLFRGMFNLIIVHYNRGFMAYQNTEGVCVVLPIRICVV